MAHYLASRLKSTGAGNLLAVDVGSLAGGNVCSSSGRVTGLHSSRGACDLDVVHVRSLAGLDVSGDSVSICRIYACNSPVTFSPAT